MKILGIESSCDECAAAVVEDGKILLSNVVATQIPFHAAYNGVVPEIASRKHTEWIYAVVKEALDKAGISPGDVDGVAATAHPGLLGSLLVGLTFAKAFAWARNLPFIAVDHLLAHLYACQLPGEAVLSPPSGEQHQVPEGSRAAYPVAYPFLGLLVSGGHSIISRVDNFDDITVLGTTIDDAVGEAFDKVSKYYGFGYPGGAAIDKLARQGDSASFRFPMPNLYKGDHPYDLSYSGLKTAVINQLEQFRVKKGAAKAEDIAASFQKTAVDILLRSLFRAAEDTKLSTIVAGGGVAANSYLRSRLAERKDLRCLFPPLELCGDNGAMIAGLGYQYLARGDRSPLSATASARVRAFKRSYP
ncbi:MAG: tRNA (adenosine(37)-N6)-threonylcarbamoyltransferase complex transferase subunit TsaD [Spirochaetaceae bacterium]|jgi:N6-L-threonylcarbamoyladenine synthase|nr:tRNA (adenosine(37)-N6)-threonylcarbamoyltransferase complex transferase subunit TsaD [Spirochaetaceae bacterium]